MLNSNVQDTGKLKLDLKLTANLADVCCREENMLKKAWNPSEKLGSFQTFNFFSINLFHISSFPHSFLFSNYYSFLYILNFFYFFKSPLFIFLFIVSFFYLKNGYCFSILPHSTLFLLTHMDRSKKRI